MAATPERVDAAVTLAEYMKKYSDLTLKHAKETGIEVVECAVEVSEGLHAFKSAFLEKRDEYIFGDDGYNYKRDKAVVA